MCDAAREVRMGIFKLTSALSDTGNNGWCAQILEVTATRQRWLASLYSFWVKSVTARTHTYVVLSSLNSGLEEDEAHVKYLQCLEHLPDDANYGRYNPPFTLMA